MFQRLLRRLSLGMADVFRRRGQDESLDAELRHHLECTIQANREAGMSRKEAERAARHTLGGFEQVKEECRDQRSGRFLDILGQDLRFAARIFRRSPGFTAAVLITLALGIGANTTIFSVVEGVLLRPLPYDDPDRVALIRADVEGHERVASLSAPELADLRDHATRNFHGFGGLWGTTAALGEPGDQEQIDLAWVTANLFPLLGTDPVLGRHFAPGEDDPEAPPVILLSHELWQSRFGGDAGIVGKPVRLGDTDRTVVGVMPPGSVLFQGAWEVTPVQYQAWIPQTYWTDRSLRWLRVVARLKPGVSPQAAQDELNLLGARLIQEHGDYDATGIHFHVLPLHGELVRQARPGILILTGAVGFVLLIACANVAGLLLARSRTRQREVAVRLALGAGRRRIFRQLMTESLLLALGGAALGLLLAKAAVHVLLTLQPANLPRLENVGLNWPVAGGALLASIIAGLLFGTVPAWKASRPYLAGALKEGERASGSGLGARARGFLVVAEVALSLVLLIGAGLMIKTFASLRGMDPGFEAGSVLSVQVPISWQKFENDSARWEFFRGLRDSLGQLPGVEHVGATSHVPLAGGMLTGTYAFDADTRERWGGVAADYRIVLPGYFQAIRTPLLSGRAFEDLDAGKGLRAVVVDELLAKQAWPGEEAVGKTLSVVLNIQTQEQEDVQVIGVTRHAHLTGLREPGSPQIYVPYWLWQRGELSYVLRTSTPPMGLVPAVRQHVAQAGGGRPAHNFQAMEGVVSNALSDVRFAVVLLALFAGMAAVLSAVGLYGIVAYSVSQRTREIGIRVALGAGRGQILRLILRPGMLLTIAGIVAGLPAAAALTRLLSSMLWRVSPLDSQTFVVIPVFLAVVALLACCIPARRALRVEPLLALRHE